MVKRIALCSSCNSKIDVEGEPYQEIVTICPKCNEKNKILFGEENLEELEIYPLYKPYEYIKIVKNIDSLDKYYWVIQPPIKEDELELLRYIQETLIISLDVRLDQIEGDVSDFLEKNIIEMSASDWNFLSQNSAAIHLLESTMDKIHVHKLCSNPNAIHIIKQLLQNNPEILDHSDMFAYNEDDGWNRLCKNSN